MQYEYSVPYYNQQFAAGPSTFVTPQPAPQVYQFTSKAVNSPGFAYAPPQFTKPRHTAIAESEIDERVRLEWASGNICIAIGSNIIGCSSFGTDFCFMCQNKCPDSKVGRAYVKMRNNGMLEEHKIRFCQRAVIAFGIKDALPSIAVQSAFDSNRIWYAGIGHTASFKECCRWVAELKAVQYTPGMAAVYANINEAMLANPFAYKFPYITHNGVAFEMAWKPHPHLRFTIDSSQISEGGANTIVLEPIVPAAIPVVRPLLGPVTKMPKAIATKVPLNAELPVETAPVVITSMFGDEIPRTCEVAAEVKAAAEVKVVDEVVDIEVPKSTIIVSENNIAVEDLVTTFQKDWNEYADDDPEFVFDQLVSNNLRKVADSPAASTESQPVTPVAQRKEKLTYAEMQQIQRQLLEREAQQWRVAKSKKNKK